MVIGLLGVQNRVESQPLLFRYWHLFPTSTENFLYKVPTSNSFASVIDNRIQLQSQYMLELVVDRHHGRFPNQQI